MRAWAEMMMMISGRLYDSPAADRCCQSHGKDTPDGHYQLLEFEDTEHLVSTSPLNWL
jgi:hypothetical protein